MRLYVIGEEDAVLGFRLAGVEGLATDDPALAEQRLEELLSTGDVAIVLVTAGIADRLRDRLAEIEQTRTTPLVLEIPAPGEPLARPPLRQLVRRALGAGA